MKKRYNFVNPDDTELVPSWGPYISSVFESNTAELYYVEQYVPSDGLAQCIYWSCCNFYFNQRGGYAGIQHNNTYNNICSIWDVKDRPPGEPTEALLEYAAPGTNVSHFQGEGTGLHTDNETDSPMPWKADTWYATVIRRWYKPDEDMTHMAHFMYDYSSGIWTEYMAASIPEKNLPLTGTQIGGFLERYSGSALGYSGVYGQHFKMHPGGIWEKPLHYVASGGEPYNSWKAETVYQDTNIKITAGGTFDNSSPSITLTPNQFDAKPKPIGPSEIISFDVRYDKDQNYITAKWDISNKQPPQLSYTIRIYSDTDPVNPVWTNHDAVPDRRQCSFYTYSSITSGNYVAVIEISSIFDEISSRKQPFTV